MSAKIQVAIICIICLFAADTALAKIQIEDYELGIAGQWRQNSWTPLRFVVKSSNESFVGKIVAQLNHTTVSMPINLSYKDLKAGTLYLFLDEVAPQLSLRLLDTEDNVIDSEFFIPEPPNRPEDLVILAIAPAKDILRELEGKVIESKISAKKGRIHVSYVDSFRNLPRQWMGYNSVDLIIIREVPLDSIQISKTQQKALIDWVTAGGTFLISGGSNYQYINSGFILSFLPVKFIELTNSSELKILNKKFDFNFDVSRNFDLIKVRPKACGQTIIEDNETPLVVKRELGDGRIVFMAFDYSARPFSDEPGFSNFWSWFTNRLAKSEVRKEMVYAPYRRHEKKIRELLTSNLSKKAPLIRFAGVFLILYIVSVFCGNLILKRYTRSTKAIIFVNFVIILIFTGFLLVSQKFWEDDILLRNFSIMKVYPESRRASLDSYIGLIGEKAATHTLEFSQPVFLKGLSNTPDLELIQATQAPGTELLKLGNMHTAPWAMNTLNAQAYFDINGTIQVEHKNKNSIVISNYLQFALEDVCVIYKEHLGKIKEIRENGKVKVELEEKLDNSIPPVFGRSEQRREFSKIIASEGILGYLLDEISSPILLGWTGKTFLKMGSEDYTFSGETLILIH